MVDLNIELLSSNSLAAYGSEIWDLLMLADKEYVPSLSSRESTTTLNLDKQFAWSGPISYFEDLMKNYVLMAFLNGKAVAFTSFVPHYSERFLEPFNPSTYVTTTIGRVTREPHAVRSALNEALDNLPDHLADPFVARRTWSTNVSQVEFLEGAGYKEAARLTDHRGPGIDTIYFVRPSGIHPSDLDPSSAASAPKYVWD